MDVFEILTGNDDPAQWWLTYVEEMATEYAKEHAWKLDDDPRATHKVIGAVKDGCQQLRTYLIECPELARHNPEGKEAPIGNQ